MPRVFADVPDTGQETPRQSLTGGLRHAGTHVWASARAGIDFLDAMLGGAAEPG